MKEKKSKPKITPPFRIISNRRGGTQIDAVDNLEHFFKFEYPSRTTHSGKFKVYRLIGEIYPKDRIDKEKSITFVTINKNGQLVKI